MNSECPLCGARVAGDECHCENEAGLWLLVAIEATRGGKYLDRNWWVFIDRERKAVVRRAWKNGGRSKEALLQDYRFLQVPADLCAEEPFCLLDLERNNAWPPTLVSHRLFQENHRQALAIGRIDIGALANFVSYPVLAEDFDE